MENDTAKLGKCCICETENESVKNLITLHKKIPDSEKNGGWGCFVCGLPASGAVAVLCDDCLDKTIAKKVEIKLACLGYPGENRRIELDKLTEEFDHDLSKHPEERDAINVLLPENEKYVEATTFIRTDEKGHHFIFVCEACESSGELTVPLNVPRFGCPTGCGAVYVPWFDSLKNEPALMCVVRPVFAEDDEEDDDFQIHCPDCGEWNRCSCFD